MAKNLILTGWYHPEYLAAAAVVYGAEYAGAADVLGVSMAELAATLDTLGGRYENIDVLGVGLTENPERLARALKELSAKGVRTRWVSRQAMPDETRAALEQEGAGFTEVHVRTDETLVDVVGSCLGVDAEACARMRPLTLVPPRDPRDYAKRDGLSVCDIWAGLHLAAGFAHRDHHDEAACGQVVKALWRGTSVSPQLPPNLRNLLDAFVSDSCRELIGKSRFAVKLRERLILAAGYDKANVLILGETGSGKQVVAEYIHNHSARKGRPFRHYNCAYGGEGNMLLDTLFGHEKGAFTDATRQKKGLFEQADGGTLFLDEIGEASPCVQSMLLTVLETGQFCRQGGEAPVQVDVRLVCATNRDLQQMVLDGTFRFDLYERLCDFPVRLEPLRDHLEDIEPLVRHYWWQMTGGTTPTKSQLKALRNYDYPGNVRELVSILKLARALNVERPESADFGEILADYMAFNRTLIEGMRQKRAAAPAASAVPSAPESDEWPDDRDELLARHAAKMHAKHGQRLSAAAKAAGVSENTFKKYLEMARARGLI